MAQTPHADPGLICPFHKLDMSEVCHTCPMWTQLRGSHPQTGEPIDDWKCAMSWLPVLLCENSLVTRQAGAAIDSLRNNLVTAIEATKPKGLLS